LTGNQPTDQDKALINHLFKRLEAIFPAWKQAFANPESIREAKRVWFDALIDNKINTPEQIARGLKEAVKQTSPFLPSVGQFIEWCKEPVKDPSHEPFLLEDKGEPATPERVQEMLREAGLVR
jgi:hypothetical protein